MVGDRVDYVFSVSTQASLSTKKLVSASQWHLLGRSANCLLLAGCPPQAVVHTDRQGQTIWSAVPVRRHLPTRPQRIRSAGPLALTCSNGLEPRGGEQDREENLARRTPAMHQAITVTVHTFSDHSLKIGAKDFENSKSW